MYAVRPHMVQIFLLRACVCVVLLLARLMKKKKHVSQVDKVALQIDKFYCDQPNNGNGIAIFNNLSVFFLWQQRPCTKNRNRRKERSEKSPQIRSCTAQTTHVAIFRFFSLHSLIFPSFVRSSCGCCCCSY